MRKKVFSLVLCLSMLLSSLPAGMANEGLTGGNADLSDLTVAGSVYYDLTPSFDAATKDYTVNMPDAADSVDITATTVDPAAALKINGAAAASGVAQTVSGPAAGENVVAVEVTAGDGAKVNTYTITINRADSRAERVIEEENTLPQTPAEYAAGDYARLAARLAGGSNHAAVVLAEGTVQVWGDNTYGQWEVPAGATGVKALAASGHTLALKEDDTVVAWGNNRYGQCDLPAVLAGVRAGAITAGPSNSAVLTEGNQILVWGMNIADVITLDSDKTVVSIAMDGRYVLALCDDGTVKAWDGQNGFLPCEAPAGFSGNVVALEAGRRHILAIKADGSVVSWGHDGYDYAVPAGLTDVRAVGAGHDYSAALTADGSIAVWGQNICDLFTIPADLGRVKALAAGSQSLYVLREDGTIAVWGRNNKGQCDVPAGLNLFSTVSTDSRLANLSVTGDGVDCGFYPAFNCEQSEVMVDVAYETQTVRITAQPYSSTATLRINGAPAAAGVAAVINAQNLAVGDNLIPITVTAADGREQTYTLHIKKVSADYALPQTPAAYQAGEYAAYARRLAAGGEHSLALKKDGTVAAWGYHLGGQCNVPAGLDGVAALAAGKSHSLALKIDGTVIAWGGTTWGGNYVGQCDVPAGLAEVVDVSAGGYFSAALNKNGTVVAWGDNDKGQCDVPAGLSNVADIQCGYEFMLALKADGTVVAWGDNRCGQCDVPAGLGGVVAVAAGTRHSMALKADGTLVTWGQTHNGTGQGDIFGHPDLKYVKAITSGNYFTAALKWDGSLVVWGSYFGSNVDMGVPLLLDQEVLAVSGNSYARYLLALNGDGTVTAWGDPRDYYKGNNKGQCDVPEGLNLFTDDVPYSGPAPNIPQTPAEYAASDYVRAVDKVRRVFVGYAVLNMDGTVMVKTTLRGEQKNDVDVVPEGLSNVKAIATSFFNVMALKADGTVVVWGYDGDGQCQVPEGVKDVIAIAANNWNTYCLALKSDGTVTAWGGNYAGQCDVPEDLSNVTAIAAGDTHCLALKADGTVTAWGNNDRGQCDVPAGLNNVARIYAGYNFSLALRNDGTVVAWGSNVDSRGAYYCGQCDVPEGLSEVVHIYVNSATCIALKSNGTVVVWGDNYCGCRNVPAGLHDVVAVNFGSGGINAVKADGSVEVWGNAASFDDESLTGLSSVLTISTDVAIFRDGTLGYYAGGAEADEISAALEGLNVLSGHYFAVDKAELLNPADGRPITTVGSQGGYRVQAGVANNYAGATPGLAIIQVRGGNGATSTGGGRVLGCVGLSGEIPVTGSTVSSDFTMPAGISGPAYVDVFVWDGWDTMVPRAKAKQGLSFSVTQ